MSETSLIVFVMFMLAFYSLMMTIVPSDMKFVNVFDFIWFAGGMIGIAGACVVATGLPCAGAIAIFGIGTVWQYIVVSNGWVQLLLFTPLVVSMIYVMMRLGRGGG